MSVLFTPDAFLGFGPDSLHLDVVPHLGRVRSERASGLRSGVRLDCPRRPGVYGMLDDRGELIYVGKARCLRTRLMTYFRPRSRDPKAGHIIKRTRLIVWEVQPTELSALLRELQLIRRFRPRFNVQGRPHRMRPLWLCLGRAPAPHVFTASRVPKTARDAFGPLPGGTRTREAARRLNDLLKLRDCPQPQEMIFADQRELFPIVRAAGCIRHEIDTCLAPCAAACTIDAYQARVRQARAFLDGRDSSLTAALDREMQAASERMQFEQAAVLRDRLALLLWTQDQLARLRQARVMTFVHVLDGQGGEWWYLVRRGQVRAVVPAASATPSLFDRVYLEEGGDADRAESLMLTLSWFRNREAECKRTMTIEDARNRIAMRTSGAGY